MADKKYVSIFVPSKVRTAIKNTGKKNNRTMIGQLTHDYLK